jgi:hypothetical protein
MPLIHSGEYPAPRGPRALPRGPDDELEFLRALGRAIHGNQQADPEA